MKVEFYMKVKLLCKLFECSRLQVLLNLSLWYSGI